MGHTKLEIESLVAGTNIKHHNVKAPPHLGSCLTSNTNNRLHRSIASVMPRKPTKTVPSPSSQQGELSSSENKPRNLLVKDATEPFTFSFVGSFGIFHELTVNQSPDEETWPGGALWDLGVLLSRVLVGLIGSNSATSTMQSNGKPRSKTYPINLPTRVTTIDWKKKLPPDQAVIVELGCGVGLTGLVAAAAWSAKVCILTDLQVVVDGITKINVLNNSGEISRKEKEIRKLNKGKAGVMAMPLCWGNEEDERSVLEVCRRVETKALTTIGSGSKKKKKGRKPEPITEIKTPIQECDKGKPHLILIGDVAYQHKPGAPSHFDALLSTLLNISGSHTIVMFGTRIRMPASVDLLNSILDHFQEIVDPLSADEIDPSFCGLKHNMTIHFLQKQPGEGTPGHIT